MKKLAAYVGRYWRHIAAAALAGIGCSAANVWIIDILKQAIDRSVQGEFVAALPGFAGKAVLAVLVGMLANYLAVYMTGAFGAGILRDLRAGAVDHIMKMPPDFMERNNFGDIMERVSSDVEAVAGYLQNYFKDCLYTPIIVTAFAVYLISLEPLLAAVCLGPLAVMVPLSIHLLKPVKLAQTAYVKLLGLTNNQLQEAFDGAPVIKAYSLQKKMRERYYIRLKETLDISDRNDLRQYRLEPLSCLIREAPKAVALCAGGFLAFRGNVTLGILVAFISGIDKINDPLVGAYQLVVRTQMAMVSVKRILEIMDMPVEEAEDRQAEDRQAEDRQTEGRQAEDSQAEVDLSAGTVFSFRNVSFLYSSRAESGQKAVEQLNLEVERGEKVALVGRSGSGKSTVLKLMCRQYEVSDGEISFCGSSFADVSPGAVRSRLALISQDTVIFPMSILDNIRIGRPDAGREEIADAARKAGCDDFIRALPDGYDTLLEERGSNLSGGQRQRIAIARAILKDAPILLLDEPTSALDKDTEKLVSGTLAAVSQGRTVVTVAHRLTTITDYDKILVMEEGRIVESGTHEELMGAGGRYHSMYCDYMASGGAAG